MGRVPPKKGTLKKAYRRASLLIGYGSGMPESLYLLNLKPAASLSIPQKSLRCYQSYGFRRKRGILYLYINYFVGIQTQYSIFFDYFLFLA